MIDLSEWTRLAKIVCKRHGSVIATLAVWVDEDGVMYPDTAFIGYTTHLESRPYNGQRWSVDDSTIERWGYFAHDEGVPADQAYRIRDEPFVYAWCSECVQERPLSVGRFRSEAMRLTNTPLGKVRKYRV